MTTDAVDFGEWKRCFTVLRIEACRTGWLGVWDALVAWVRRRPRLTVSQEVCFSLYVDVDEFHIYGRQLEYRDET